MTLNVTVPDTVYRPSRQSAAALAEQLFGWNRAEQMAERGSRERFLAALDKVPAAEPAPEDRLEAPKSSGSTSAHPEARERMVPARAGRW